MAKNGRLPTPFRDAKGRYFARRRVPKDLRSLFKGEFVQKSLGTRDPVEAARLFPSVNAEIDAQFEAKRRSAQGWQIHAAEQPARFERIVIDWVKGLDDDEALLLRSGLQIALGTATTIEQGLTRWSPSRRGEIVQAIARSAAEASGLSNAPEPMSASFQAYVDKHLAEIVARILPPSVDSTAEARLHTPEAEELDLTITLAGLQKIWATSKKPAKSSYDELTSTISDFVSVYGNIPAAEVTQADLLDFKKRLLLQPRTMPRHSRSLPLSERAKIAGPRLTAETVGKKLTLLKALLSFAFGKGLLPQNAGSRIETGPKHRKGKRAQFLPDEVAAIFKLPLFQPKTWKYHRTVSDITLAWLMLIGLTNGPRQKEAGQAELADVVTTGSIIAIRVTAESEVEVQCGVSDLPTERKSIKNEESERFLIIHPILIQLGFGHFLAALRKAGATQLFPDLWQSGVPSTHDASRYLNAAIDRITTRRKVCYHSFRHTWLAEAENTDMKERTMRQLSGHAPRDESEKYGEAYLPILALNAAKLSFDLVDWDTLISTWSTVDWDEVVALLLQRYSRQTRLAA